MILYLLITLLTSLLVLLTVAFFTLFERKIMGSFHQRLGPNKISLIGILQPLLDALKLFLKNKMNPNFSNVEYYLSIPTISLFMALIIFMIMPSLYKMFLNNYSFLFFLCISSGMVFIVLLSGWSSNSKYSLLGSLRSISQSISYEAVLSTLILFIFSMMYSYSILNCGFNSSYFMTNLSFLWMICFLAETHRAPFDFSEAESELVSGFNTEYTGAMFAYLFLSEYIMILFGCQLFTILFILGPLEILNSLIFNFISLMIAFITIWIRITFCRYRYDVLMSMAWKILLPLSLVIFLFVFILN